MYRPAYANRRADEDVVVSVLSDSDSDVLALVNIVWNRTLRTPQAGAPLHKTNANTLIQS